MKRAASLLSWRPRSMGITLRTALLAWLVTIGTLLVFAMGIVPAQKRIFLDHLRSKANGVAVSVREVAASAAVNEDYSAVVDYCVELLKADVALDCVILTRNDGFSLIHERTGWRSGTLGPEWRPADRVPSGTIEFVPLLNHRVYAYSQPFNYSGIEWGWIHIGLSLRDYNRSVALVYWRTGILAVVCMLLALAGTLFYAKHLVRPILQLQGVVQRVTSGDMSARAAADRSDELGQLAASVNAMTEALLRRDRTLKEANEMLEQRVRDRTRELQEQVEAKERAHEALAEAQQNLMQLSREAGRAEIATGVLHSVGNVLNSVNVSATLVQNQLGHSSLEGLRRASELVARHRDHLLDYLANDPQGRHLPEYLIEVTAALAAEHSTWRAELDALAQHVGHIKEIVAMQQSYARVAGVIERLTPRELVHAALRVKQPVFERHGVIVTTDHQPCPAVNVDKHKVLQILINLLVNARWAVDAVPPAQRRIQVAVRPAGSRVQIVVTDHGVGIPPENLARIFQHGFTTRKQGHGFGLHMAALAAQELGGTLTVHSDGPGRGATFTLELPAETPA